MFYQKALVLRTKISGLYFFLENEQNENKKVLLRECKRHTAHHIASAQGGTYLGGGTYLRHGGCLSWGTPSPVLTWPGGTYLGWGVTQPQL